jgi:cysteine desulfurase / selenocysteine lyase
VTHATLTDADNAGASTAPPSLGVRGDFPIFARQIDGRPLVYLDSGATSQKPAVVIDALSEHLRAHNANVHRGVYALAQEADAAYDGARRRVAAFVGADRSSGSGGAAADPALRAVRPGGQTTVFTKNVTEAINLVAYAWGRGSTDGRPNVNRGDAVLITQLEHHANIVPWQVLCRERGAELRYLEVDARGELSLDQLDAELARGDVKLVAVSHVSNVLGTITPVAEMTARIRAAGAVSLIDGAQAVPHMPVDVGTIGADFYAWTGHKALGPTGIGVLHGRTEILEQMEPFMSGGDMIASVDFQSATWNELPYKFEAGTPPIAEAVGLGAAVDYLSGLGMTRVREHEQALTEYMLQRLAELPGLRVVGPPEAERRGGLASFTIEGIHPHDIAELAGRGGVCIRAGHHCAQPLMRCLGVGATARASVGVYNEPADIDALVDALVAGRKVFGL